MEREDFFVPRYEGARFDGHALPVDVLEDLICIQKAVYARAKKIFLAENPDRKRVPRNFFEKASIALTDIRAGSAVPVLKRIKADQSDEFHRSLKDVVTAISMVAQNSNDRIDSDILSDLRNYGKGLRKGEVIKLPTSEAGQYVAIRENFRENFLRLLSTDELYTSIACIEGAVASYSPADDSMEIETESERRFALTIDRGFQGEVSDALKEYGRDGCTVKVFGRGIFCRPNLLEKVEKAFHLVLLYSDRVIRLPDVEKRFREIGELRDGWLDGNGVTFESSFLDSSRTFLNKVIREDLPAPYLYPLEDAIRAEWSFGLIEVVLSLNLDGTVQFWTSGTDPCFEVECVDFEGTHADVDKVHELLLKVTSSILRSARSDS